MRSILDGDDFDFRFEVGLAELSSRLELSDCRRIVQSISRYFTVVRVKAQIDQMLDGMNALGIGELIRSNPRTIHKLFMTQPEPITPDSLLNLFRTMFSPEGSNRREDEEQVIMYWVNFLEIIECELKASYYIKQSIMV